ncbi:MAG: hypothetical protein JST48_09450 [Bacteroidetes bacterium]|nr:hypothetical protein [Bacteroidota bacterium]
MNLRFFSLTVTFLIASSGFHVFAQTNLVPDDQEFQALKAIYDSLGGASWTTKTNWPTPGNWPATATASQMATWYGVTVTNGDVTGVVYTGNNVVGKIPSAIANLKALKTLQFYATALTDIPQFLNQLTSLTILNLGNQATLHGQIPDLSLLTSLTTFSLRNCSGLDPAPIPTWITTSLPNLAILDLNNTHRTGTLPGDFSNLVNLTYMDLSSNNLTNTIPSNIGYLNKLQTLRLNNNQLTGNIPPELGDLMSLVTLNLGNNKLSGDIPSSICNLTNLTDLELCTNQLFGSIPASIGNLSKLRYLYLYNNKLSGELPASMSELTSIYSLRVGHNELTGELPDFSKHTIMQQFIANYNLLSGSIDMAKFSNAMVDFQIGSNKFSGTFPSLDKWVNLSGIVIWGNQFSGNFPSVANLTKLDYISADANRFNSIPSSLLNISKHAHGYVLVYFDDNLITNITNLTTDLANNNIHPDSTLMLKLNNNKLDFSVLEPLVNMGITTFTYSPQKNVSDRPTQSLSVGADLLLAARTKGSFTSNITWQKLQTSNNTWIDISSSNADPLTGNTYRIANTNASAEGKYRWNCTSTKATGFTLQSDPIEVKTPQRIVVDSLGFQYKYDGRRRLIAKKLPGADWVYMVYDNRDRLVLTQDGNQRLKNQWTFTKYDVLNRPVMSGIYTHTGYVDQVGMSTLISTTNYCEYFNGATNNHGYSYTVFPNNLSLLDVHTVTYYDNYNFKALYADSRMDYKPDEYPDQYKIAGSSFTNVIGKVTGTKTKLMELTNYFLWNVNYYDDHYRVIQTASTNTQGGIDRNTNVYDFVGKVMNTKSTHSVGTAVVSTSRRFEYDHVGRLINSWHSVNGLPEVLLSKNEYNEIGQLVDKRLYSTNGDSGNTFKQSVDYRYNIRGWLTSMNNSKTMDDGGATNDDTNDLFGLNLHYNDPVPGLTSANDLQYNGNISAMEYSSNSSLGLPKARGYNFKYDPMNRLQSASHNEFTTAWSASPSYHEDNLSYDLNGNILSLNRTGDNGAQMDVLQYNYRGNQLLRVNEGIGGDKQKGFIDGNVVDDDYAYDTNGNLLTDRNKGITGINYNSLNLPEKVTKSATNYVYFYYDATGRKVAKESYDRGENKNTDYQGDFIYENLKLQFINHEEGRVVINNQQVANAQLFSNPDAQNTDGFLPNAGVSLSSVNVGSENYVKVICNQGNSTPGVVSDIIMVEPGKRYEIRVKGYTVAGSTAGKATLFVSGWQNVIAGGNPQIVYNTTQVPIGSQNEALVSQQFDVPTGIRRLKIGVLWSAPVVGEQLFINSMELRSITGTHWQPVDAEYQYHLKDHLGNVRLTFTTKKEVDQPKATFETANATTEASQFLRYDDARTVNSTLFDHTHNGVTAYSERLSGSSNEVNGVARSISVMPGDTVNMEVYAKYVDGSNPNNTAALTQLLAQIVAGTASAGTVIDGAGYTTNGTTPFSYAGLIDYGSDNPNAPKAFLNYLVFDRSYALLDGGYVQMQGTAKEDGTNVPHERLFAQVVTRQAGYMYIWLSNESPTPVEVYFDDFKVTHTKSPVVQTDDYYPFGLAFNSYSRENSTPNKFKFQGQEHIYDLGLNWDSFKWRNHQPDIGRFFNIDPLAEKYLYNSPYAFSENKVTSHVELEGLEAVKPPTPGEQSRRQKNAELSFLIAHPPTGMAIGKYTEGSNNISTIAANFSINATINDPKSQVGEGSNRNALRHGIWQAMITREFGKDMAATAGYAHEGFTVPEVGVTPNGYTVAGGGKAKLAEADAMADLLNNIIGQGIGEDNPNATNVGLALAVINEFKDNGMWTVQETKGGYSITRAKLTQKQYEQAVGNTQSLRENGLKQPEEWQLKRKEQ